MRIAANPAGQVLIGQDVYTPADAIEIADRIEHAAWLAAALHEGK